MQRLELSEAGTHQGADQGITCMQFLAAELCSQRYFAVKAGGGKRFGSSAQYT